MKRWNGWGDETISQALASHVLGFLQAEVGTAKGVPDATLQSVIAKVPASRLSQPHPLISVDAELRVRHARGQSFPDLVATRSGEIEQFPDGVALPESAEQLAELIRYCYKQDIVMIPYGGGTSVVGHINPPASDKPVVTIALTRMTRLRSLNEESQIATFDAGTPGPLVEAQLRAKGYTLGHFPQSFELSTLGGWVASRSSGQQSLRYGRIEQLFAGGRLETAQGSMQIPAFPATGAGPDIRDMLLGSEGRLGIISEVQVRVSKLPEKEAFYVAFFPSWHQAKAACRELVQSRAALSMLRLSNVVETDSLLKLADHPHLVGLLERYLKMRGVAEGKCMLTFGITASKRQFGPIKRNAMQILRQFGGVNMGTFMGSKWAETRFQAPYLRNDAWEQGYAIDTLETATNWENVDNLLNLIEENLRNGLADEGVKVHAYTHLSHCYAQGCSIYCTYIYPFGKNHQHTLERWHKLKHSTSSLIVNNGGTISHQHGVGKDHAPHVHVEKGELGMQLIESLCHSADSKQLFNPGTLIPTQPQGADHDDAMVS